MLLSLKIDAKILFFSDLQYLVVKKQALFFFFPFIVAKKCRQKMLLPERAAGKRGFRGSSGSNFAQ